MFTLSKMSVKLLKGMVYLPPVIIDVLDCCQINTLLVPEYEINQVTHSAWTKRRPSV